MSDVSPSDAVDSLEAPTSSEGQLVDEATGDHAAAEGVDASSSSWMGSRSSFQEALLSTEPATPLERVETPWDPEMGGPRRIMRAVQKATGADGLPAVVDAVLGVLETLQSIEAEDDGADDDGVDHPAPVGDPAR